MKLGPDNTIGPNGEMLLLSRDHRENPQVNVEGFAIHMTFLPAVLADFHHYQIGTSGRLDDSGPLTSGWEYHDRTKWNSVKEAFPPTGIPNALHLLMEEMMARSKGSSRHCVLRYSVELQLDASSDYPIVRIMFSGLPEITDAELFFITLRRRAKSYWTKHELQGEDSNRD